MNTDTYFQDWVMQAIVCLVRNSLVSLLLLSVCASAQTQWTAYAPGIHYSLVRALDISPWAKVHAFKIDLSKADIRIGLAKEYSSKALTAKQFALASSALIATNAGFFDTDYQPLGLRMRDNRILHKAKNISWWSVFFIRSHRAFITPLKKFHYPNNISFAIQAGPRLVVNSQVMKLKPGLAERTAIGIQRNGHVIVAVTENSPMDTEDFAQILQRGEQQNGLGCEYALNLDGGGSTQLYASAPEKTVSVFGFTPVTDALLIQSRQR